MFDKKKNYKKTTLGRSSEFTDKEGNKSFRAIVEIDPHPITTKGIRYSYGRIQLSGISKELIGKPAFIQVFVPYLLADNIESPSKAQEFVEQPVHKWPTMLENKEQRNARIQKEIASKIRQVKEIKPQNRGDSENA